MATLKNALLDAGFSADPSITLKTYIQDNYTIVNPPKKTVSFDTKFGRGDFYNYIIVEDMPYIVKVQSLGMGRFLYHDKKRIQIFCMKNNAKNNVFLIKEHLEDIINANPTGAALVAAGIQYAKIENWNPIIAQPVPDTINEMETTSTEGYRTHALVTLHYEKYAS